MSEFKLISPLLDSLDMGEPISEHDGVHCCPAMAKDSDEKYIVKIISIPASQTQLDALLLTGAYTDRESALAYFKELADGVEGEIQTLQRLSQLEGFLPIAGWQTVPMENGSGYQVYLLGTYKRTLETTFRREPMTHLGAINLGLDLCAALAVCRRAGYLYVDLKPSNVFVTADKEYRIGDLGFIRLDSLKYASLPEKYRSAYTAPEIADAFASLNETVDIYAAGLILYQAYNNGALPVLSEDGTMPLPEFADYEMAEIILKACATDPTERWQDPIQMGHALVSYMQRNGANDTPIVPPPVVNEEIRPEEFEPADSEQVEDTQEQVVLETEISPEREPEESDETEAADESNEAPANEEEGFENLNFLLDMSDETDPGNIPTEIEDVEISEEVSEILTQAEALEDIEVPEPVVIPEHVEIPMPEPVPLESEPAETEAEQTEEAADDGQAEESTDDESCQESEAVSEDTPKAKKGSCRWLLISLCLLAAIAVATAGFLFYRNYYLLRIDAITLEGNETSLVVQVVSDADDSLLTVICSDSHGNQIPAPVVDGKATFENLTPNTAYNVKVVAEGFHKLTGDIATAYSTPAQTSIVQFSAVTGAEDGSVIIGFTVDGPDDGNWSVMYSAEGEETKTVPVASHMLTLTGLTVGKEYTFTLASDTQLSVTGINEIKHTASKLVYAQNLIIANIQDGKLTADWDSPSDTVVTGWTVRCYNDSGYNETILTADTSAIFENIDTALGYTVEVTAAGMSVSQHANVAKNALTATNFQADTSDPAKLVITWESPSGAPAGGWVLNYGILGHVVQDSIACPENRAEITNALPGAVYTFRVQEANGNTVLAEQFTFQVPEAAAFSAHSITPDNMEFSLYKAPNVVYTNHFTGTDKIYMLIKLDKRTEASQDATSVVFAVRDEEGNLVSYSSTKLIWDNMWEGGDCILAIPETPQTAGAYTISIYFDSALVTEQSFTVA